MFDILVATVGLEQTNILLGCGCSILCIVVPVIGVMIVKGIQHRSGGGSGRPRQMQPVPRRGGPSGNVLARIEPVYDEPYCPGDGYAYVDVPDYAQQTALVAYAQQNEYYPDSSQFATAQADYIPGAQESAFFVPGYNDSRYHDVSIQSFADDQPQLPAWSGDTSHQADHAADTQVIGSWHSAPAQLSGGNYPALGPGDDYNDGDYSRSGDYYEVRR